MTRFRFRHPPAQTVRANYTSPVTVAIEVRISELPECDCQKKERDRQRNHRDDQSANPSGLPKVVEQSKRDPKNHARTSSHHEINRHAITINRTRGYPIAQSSPP